MDNKTLSDFMPKVSSEGEITYGEISSSQLVTLTIDHIIKVLTDIKDPEMDMNIYDLGLIYDISIDNFNNIKIIFFWIYYCRYIKFISYFEYFLNHFFSK